MSLQDLARAGDQLERALAQRREHAPAIQPELVEVFARGYQITRPQAHARLSGEDEDQRVLWARARRAQRNLAAFRVCQRQVWAGTLPGS